MNNLYDFRIIVIDDNIDIHNDFIKILTTNTVDDTLYTELDEKLFGNEESNAIKLPKFIIDTAMQGKEGFEKIKIAAEADKPYSLAFVDIRMPPGWDGIETIKNIWEIDPNMQIVICTAYSDYSWEQTVEKLGMTDNLLVLKKPFDNTAVRQLACALTKKWQLMQEIREYTKLLENKVQERTDSLQQSLSMMRATLESSADGILVVDNIGNLVDYNNKFIEIFEIPESILNTKDNLVIFKYIINQFEDPEEFIKKVQDLRNNPDSISIDVNKLKNGRVLERYTQPHRLNGNKIVGRVWSFRDITTRIFLEEKLEYQALHDPLTGLPNRVLLMDRLRQAIEKSKRNHTLVGILFFDLDRFKLINDSLTHAVGDELLQSISQRLSTITRDLDTLCRLGGDEFVMLVSDLEDENSLSAIARKLLKELQKPFNLAKRILNITASLGISIYPRDGTGTDELLRAADLAMYRSKEYGKNQFQFYTSDLNQKSIKRWEDENALQNALLNNEFFICYQPQIDTTAKKIISVEALIRWRNKKNEIILPMDFIPLAEETGLIIPIGEWILREACKQNKKWQDNGLSAIRVAVNVATAQFKQNNFVDIVSGILTETGLKPEYLEIEVTENVLLSQNEVTETIIKLKELGLQIVLDDFGTGNSSLNYLRKIPIDRLKIDRSFIEHINTDKNDEILIKAIIDMANSLNLEVLAEGVETQNQLQFLQKQHCDEFQGFYFSEPLSSPEMELYLTHSDKFKDFLKKSHDTD